MHDVTEGGVLGAVWELAYANGCGAEVFSERISIHAETRALCAEAGLDPLRLIGSGSLLIACKDGESLVHALKANGIEAAIIGRAIAGTTCLFDGDAMEEPHADEIYKLYENA
jgi:hydrogenase maturation factor